jgi:ubiquinone/menaquinone biosynthesis C-methylase UbiE
MTTVQTNVRDYLLGNTPHEYDRLKLQASILGGWTEGFFRSAGIGRGMRILDLGCGMGDVSLLAAELAWPTGSVVAIDRDPVVIEKARERASRRGTGARIDFVHEDLLAFHSARPFDAVVGRYFLLYQPDPVVAIRHAVEQIRAGGVVCFHETDFGNPIRSHPDNTLFERAYQLLTETVRRTGVPVDFGLRLTASFLDAGLSWPTIKAEVPIGGEAGSYLYGWVAETLRSLLPRIEQFGLASAEELDLDTLAMRMEADAVSQHSQLFGPLQVGAWTTKG